MCTIFIRDIISDRSYPEAGEILYNIIIQNIESEDKIILDMESVDAIPSMFLNVSIGRFIEEYGVDLLKQKISFAKITKSQVERLKEYIEKFS